MNAQMNRPAPSQTEHTITSIEIAKISNFRHADLLKSIRKQEVAWSKVSGVNFSLAKYTDEQGKKRPMYKLNRMESLYISSKFNDEVRARLVMRWYDLETKNVVPEAQIHTLVPSLNDNKELPVVDLPMEVEVFNNYPLRIYTVNGVRLTLVTDLLRSYGSTARAYKNARKANKGTMKAVKLIDWNHQVTWAVDPLGRKVIEGQLQYQKLLNSNQTTLAL